MIDGSGEVAPVMSMIDSGQTLATVLDGLTITGGTGDNQSKKGGGMYSINAGATLRNCIITGNSALGNTVHSSGGGLAFDSGIVDTAFILENCLIADNIAAGTGDGGGLWVLGNQVSITGCTFSNNSAPDKGDGFYRSGAAFSFTISNSIFYGNGDVGDANEIYMANGTGTINYTDIEGGQNGVTKDSGTLNWGPGILNVDPKFVNPSAGDYHLKPGSPVSNKGDPAYTGIGETDIDGDPRVLYGRIDLGADEWVRARPKPVGADPSPPPTAVP